jgi:hypothetical protein
VTEPTETISVREHLTALIKATDVRYSERFAAQNEALQVALVAAEKAVLKAEVASEKRFESMNEFRGALNDMVGKMMPRAETDQRFTALSEKLDEMQARLAGYGDQLGDMTSKDMLEARVVSLNGQIAALAAAASQREAKSIGIFAGWGYIVGAVSFVISIISVAYAVVFKGNG